MTGVKKAKKVKSHGLAACGCVILILMLMVQGEAAMQGVKDGMRLCVHTMIPALFPLMVVSEWMVRGNVGKQLANVLPVRWICGLPGFSGAGRCAFLMGILCGFPIGSRVAAGYYRRGQLSDEEFSRLVCVCNLPSTAFLIGGVGTGLFGSASFGRWLCLLSLLAALFVGVLFRVFFARKEGKGKHYETCGLVTEQGEQYSLPMALAAAAENMLNVCATVMLFCSLTRVLDAFMISVGVAMSAGGRAVLLGVLELSGGVSATAAALPASQAAILCAALIGWGGLSVHCQIMSVCHGCPMPLARFWLSRFLQSLFCALGVAALLAWGNIEFSSPEVGETIARFGDFPSGFLPCVAWALGVGGMIVSLICLVWLKTKKGRRYGKQGRS